MKTPYTSAPLDAFVAAQTCAALVLTAVVWRRPVGSFWRSLPLVAAAWLAVVQPLLTTVPYALTHEHPSPKAPLIALYLIAFGGTLTAIASLDMRLAITALVGEVALYKIANYVTDSDLELVSLHFAWLGALVGAHRLLTPASPSGEPPPRPLGRWRADDLLVFLLATLAAGVVCATVLDKSSDGDDEWTYTWQAIVFSYFKAYVPVPPCGEALRNHWIFFVNGRAFGQYTPGWPLFMAPFARVGLAWLAGPVAHGFFAVGIARLSRRMSAGQTLHGVLAAPQTVRAAGFLGAVAATAGACPLLNGASRFPHILICALFAWCFELLSSLIYDEQEKRRQALVGFCLGLGLSGLLSTRPPDGGTIGAGLFLFFVYGLGRKRLSLVAVLSTTVGFVLLGGLTLIILRAQMGAWFKTAYGISQTYYPWAETRFSVPKPHEFKSGLPLATIAYTFWPAAPAFGIAGLLATRRESRAIAGFLAFSTAAIVSLYVFLEFGRGDDFGYGPRYELTYVVPMAVGTAVILAPLFASALRDASMPGPRLSGPAALALFAIVFGTVRIAPYIYQTAHEDVWKYNGVERAARLAKLHNAVVTVRAGETYMKTLDITRNVPLPGEPDVIFAGENSPEELQCLKEHYPNRKFYRAHGMGEVVLDPL